MEAASCHRLSPIYWNIIQPCSLFTLFLAVRWSFFASNHVRICFSYLILVYQLVETIAWWLVYRNSFYGNGFEFVPIKVHKSIMLSGCNLNKLIFLLSSWVRKCSILIGSRQRFAQVESSILRSVTVRQCTKIGCKSAMF